MRYTPGSAKLWLMVGLVEEVELPSPKLIVYFEADSEDGRETVNGTWAPCCTDRNGRRIATSWRLTNFPHANALGGQQVTGLGLEEKPPKSPYVPTPTRARTTTIAIADVTDERPRPVRLMRERRDAHILPIDSTMVQVGLGPPEGLA
jgi:hypothetical protein